MESVWQNKIKLPTFPPLSQDLSCDVLIIGGGIAGILCAHALQEAGISYALAEATTICNGITKHTTAKLTAQHGLIYDKMIRRFGLEKAKQYRLANEEALSYYRTLCRTIDCDFEEQDAYVYSLNDRRCLEKEVAALQKIGVKATLEERIPLPFSVVGAVRDPQQAQFHPLKFLAQLAKALHIYEHTCVKELKGTVAHTDRGIIRAKKIIVTTHFPFLNKHGSYFLKMYQHRSYVLAMENAPLFSGMYVDEAQKGLSFRHAGNLLLVGGSGHRTGMKGGGFTELRQFVKSSYPHAKERYHWATQDCMTLDSVPYIGPYSASTKNLYVATGFCKWGMTTSMVAARILCDLIQEKENPYAALYSPSRSILRPQLLSNAWESSISLLTPSKRRCPHLGCALKWNPQEHTWDCPCHGSRFTQDGSLIDNPATGDLK